MLKCFEKNAWKKVSGNAKITQEMLSFISNVLYQNSANGHGQHFGVTQIIRKVSQISRLKFFVPEFEFI